jgi:hypothetical protein
MRWLRLTWLAIRLYFAEPNWEQREHEPLKECPFCFELIRARATRCKWCTGGFLSGN